MHVTVNLNAHFQCFVLCFVVHISFAYDGLDCFSQCLNFVEQGFSLAASGYASHILTIPPHYINVPILQSAH